MPMNDGRLHIITPLAPCTLKWADEEMELMPLESVIIPEGVNVKINSTSIFGGVSDKKNRHFDKNVPTLYINATGIFGGVDVK